MRTFWVTAALLMPLLLGCATGRTEFLPFEAKQTDFEGQGGSRSVQDGIDFWEFGEPPRRYRVLGIIVDERSGGRIQQSSLKEDVAALAKKQDADAVIVWSRDSRFAGAVNTGIATASGNTAFGTGVSVPVSRTTNRYVVIKYLN